MRFYSLCCLQNNTCLQVSNVTYFLSSTFTKQSGHFFLEVPGVQIPPSGWSRCRRSKMSGVGSSLWAEILHFPSGCSSQFPVWPLRVIFPGASLWGRTLLQLHLTLPHGTLRNNLGGSEKCPRGSFLLPVKQPLVLGRGRRSSQIPNHCLITAILYICELALCLQYTPPSALSSGAPCSTVVSTRRAGAVPSAHCLGKWDSKWFGVLLRSHNQWEVKSGPQGRCRDSIKWDLYIFRLLGSSNKSSALPFFPPSKFSALVWGRLGKHLISGKH